MVILPTVRLPCIKISFDTFIFEVQILPEMDAPPKTVKLPPDPIPVEVFVFDIYIGEDTLNILESNVISDKVINGLVPLPTTKQLGVKVVLPVPPYGTLMVFADQVPVFTFPKAVTCVKLEFMFNVVPTFVRPVPASI
jgi:hypothetical protein